MVINSAERRHIGVVGIGLCESRHLIILETTPPNYIVFLSIICYSYFINGPKANHKVYSLVFFYMPLPDLAVEMCDQVLSYWRMANIEVFGKDWIKNRVWKSRVMVTKL